MKKKLGLDSGIAICVGLIVATSCLVSLGTGIGLAGKAFIIPMFLVAVLNMFVALSFSELHGLMPNVNGGTGQYLLVGLGPLPSIIGNISAYIIAMVLASTAELAMCGTVLKQMFFPSVDARIIAVIVIGLFFVINCFSVDLFAKVQKIVVILLIGSMILLGAIGALGLGTGEIILSSEQTTPEVTGVGGVMGLAALAFWLFIGVEFVIPVAKDMKNPRRNVLLSMILGLLILFGVQALLGYGMTNYVTLDVLASDASGTPHMTYAYNLLGNAGKYWMGFVTILAAVSTMNTIYASTSRIMQGMSEEGMLPKAFGKTNKKGAAILGLALIGICDAILIVSNLAFTEGISFFILAASCFWLFTYCLVHGIVLLLRYRYPDADRNKKLIFGGIPQIIGILGNIYMIWNISSGEARIKIYLISGVLFLLLVAYSTVWVVGVMKVHPFKPVDLEVMNSGSGNFSESISAESNTKLEQVV